MRFAERLAIGASANEARLAGATHRGRGLICFWLKSFRPKRTVIAGMI